MSQKLLKYFLKLGMTGFGGPLALIQQMRKDLVESEQLIDGVHFDQAFTLIKAMPGPIAFQMAVHCGQHLFGFTGALIAGFGLIFPAFCMMILMGIFYSQIIVLSGMNIFFNGMQYAVAAIILLGLKSFIINYKKSILFWFIVLITGILFFNKSVPESLLIIGSGILIVAVYSIIKNKNHMTVSVIAPLIFVTDTEKLFTIFKTCFTAGALVFGTGLAIFPFLQSNFVDHLAWLPLSVFNDGVTFGQMTPGPVTIATTFYGYKMAGLQGAVIATVGLLIPPFFHMTTWFPKAMTWMQKQTWIPQFILGSSAAVVGCLLVTVYKMNSLEVRSFNFWIIFGVSFFVLYLKPKTSLIKLLIFSGLFNLFLMLVGGFTA